MHKMVFDGLVDVTTTSLDEAMQEAILLHWAEDMGGVILDGDSAKAFTESIKRAAARVAESAEEITSQCK